MSDIVPCGGAGFNDKDPKGWVCVGETTCFDHCLRQCVQGERGGRVLSAQPLKLELERTPMASDGALEVAFPSTFLTLVVPFRTHGECPGGGQAGVNVDGGKYRARHVDEIAMV